MSDFHTLARALRCVPRICFCRIHVLTFALSFQALARADIDQAVHVLLSRESYVVRSLDSYLQHLDMFKKRRKEMLHKKWVETVAEPLRQRIAEKVTLLRGREKTKQENADYHCNHARKSVTVPPFAGPLFQRQQKAEEEKKSGPRDGTGRRCSTKELKHTDKAGLRARLPQGPSPGLRRPPEAWYDTARRPGAHSACMQAVARSAGAEHAEQEPFHRAAPFLTLSSSLLCLSTTFASLTSVTVFGTSVKEKVAEVLGLLLHLPGGRLPSTTRRPNASSCTRLRSAARRGRNRRGPGPPRPLLLGPGHPHRPRGPGLATRPWRRPPRVQPGCLPAPPHSCGPDLGPFSCFSPRSPELLTGAEEQLLQGEELTSDLSQILFERQFRRSRLSRETTGAAEKVLGAQQQRPRSWAAGDHRQRRGSLSARGGAMTAEVLGQHLVSLQAAARPPSAFHCR
nr:protein FAM228A [Cavia porcellus]